MTNAHRLERPVPAWFDDAKLGIFIHWTAAAIPAYAAVRRFQFAGEGVDAEAEWRELPYAEMYQNTMAVPGSSAERYHAENYGDLPFDAFVHQFRDSLHLWDPEPWADLFARAGARYVVLVTKTEDGFLLWPSAHPNPHKPGWQAERDVVGELAAAVRARGMRFGTYYSGGLDWTFGGHPVTSMETFMSALAQGDDFIAYADAHWRELIERYETSIMWNDYAYPLKADVDALFRLHRERVPDGVINDRFDYFGLREAEVLRDFTTLEYATDYSTAPADRKWEACRGIGTSFGYNRMEGDSDYSTSTALIHELADIVARGGNFLLNVGPTAVGEIPWLQAQRLLDIGWWLARNGDAIYATRRWHRPAGSASDGLDVRYTASADAVYATVLGTPKTADVDLDVRVDTGAQVSLAGRPHELPFVATPGGVRVTLPEAPDEQPAIALRLSPPQAVRPA